MFQQSDSESNNNTKKPENVAELELVSYLREKSLLVKSDFEEGNTNPLEWWRDNSYQYKLLFTLTVKYLCVADTNVPSYKAFSYRSIINSKRACIHPENINMLCFLHNNL